MRFTVEITVEELNTRIPGRAEREQQNEISFPSILADAGAVKKQPNHLDSCLAVIIIPDPDNCAVDLFESYRASH